MRESVTRRSVLGAVSTIGVAGLAGCSGDSGDGSDGGDGDSGGSTSGSTGSNGGGGDSYHIGMSVMGTGLSWFTAFLKGGEWYAEDNGHEWTVTDAEFSGEKQIRQANSLIAQDIDALMIMPIDSATSKRIAQEATDNDIPVFTSNATINSDLVSQFASFGNYNASYEVGQNIVDRLEEKYGEPRGRILAGQDSQSYQLGVARRQGVHDAVSEYPNVEIIGEFASAEGADQAFQAFNNLFQANDDIDAVFGANQPKLTGGLRALEQQGLKHEVGDEDHVIFGSIDAGPSAIQAIKDRFVDFIVDQPTQYYNALVVHWITKYLDAGKDPSVLPQMGDTVEADAVDLSANAEEHVGVDPWAEPLWAPAEVVPYEQDGTELHPYIKTSHSVINGENADEPYLWGNWVGDA